MNKEFRLGEKGNRWLSFGHSYSGLGLGFRLERRSLTIDLLIFWLGVEW